MFKLGLYNIMVTRWQNRGDRMQFLWEYLKTTKKPILLYGTGNGADKIIDRLLEDGVSVSGVFASDGFVRNQNFRGFKVISYSEAKTAFKDFIVLVAFGSKRPEVLNNIEKIALEQELYVVDVPVYGNTVFDKVFFEANIKDYESILDSFSDKHSIDVFKAIVDFKLSGSLPKLKSAEDSEDETFKTLIPIKKNEVVFDLGAYCGDTAEQFLRYQPELSKIVAVEPAPKNFKKLEALSNNEPKIIPINAAVSNNKDVVHFSGKSGRNQSIGTGKELVRTVKIDELTKDFGKPDFIKFDVEGAEAEAIISGEETIKTYGPTLYISTYHRSEDLFLIPKLVLSINPNYKMFIRHYPHIPCWDTYYIFKK